jgi:HK97 gp10 family phage protein
MAVTMEWKNAAELLGRMRTLQFAVKEKIGYAGAYAGAKVLRDAAQAQAASNGSIDTGSMIGNIATAREKGGSGDGRYQYTIGVRHGTRKQRKEDDDPWYWWFVEFGTAKQAAKPFITPMFESSGVRNEMLARVALTVERGIKRNTPKE